MSAGRQQDLFPSAVTVRAHTRRNGVFVREHPATVLRKRDVGGGPGRRLPLGEVDSETGGMQVIPLPYMAGSSRPRDFEAAMDAGGGVGVVIGELSRPMLRKVAGAVGRGREVFVDSGAFSVYTRAQRDGEDLAQRRWTDWIRTFDDVLDGYEGLSAMVRESEGGRKNAAYLMLVAPDVVGNQDLTIALLAHYRDRLTALQDAGHEVIIPMQVGAMPAHDMFRWVRDNLFYGVADFVPGIPSAKEAMSDGEFEQFIREADEPPRLHILGAASPGNKRFQARMAVIAKAYKNEVPGVTADSMRLRAITWGLSGLTGDERKRRMTELLAEAVPAAWKQAMIQKSILFFKAQRPGLSSTMGDLFETTVPVKAHTRKDGAFVPAHTARVKKRQEGPKSTKPDSELQAANRWLAKWLPIRSRESCEKHVNKYGLTINANGKAERMPSWDKQQVGVSSKAKDQSPNLTSDEVWAKVEAALPAEQVWEAIDVLQDLYPDKKLQDGQFTGANVARAIMHTRVNGIKATHEKAKAALKEKHGDNPLGLEVKHKDRDQWALILPDASEPGKFRASRFDRRGFYSHATEDTPEQVLDELVKDGFVEHAPGILDRLAETDEWAEGMRINEEIQRVNAEGWARSRAAQDASSEAKRLKKDAAALRRQAAEVNKESGGRAAKNLVDINADGSYVPVPGRAARKYAELRKRAADLTKRANALDPPRKPTNPKLQIRTVKTKPFPGGSANGMIVTNIPERTLSALGWHGVWFKPGVPQKVYAQAGKYPDEWRDEMIFEGDVNRGLVDAINARLTMAKSSPSEAQLKAGNYKKPKRRFQGLEISIENPAGSVRSGVDRDGKPWRTKMRYPYGYILGTKGVDKDHVDCYLGPMQDADTAYVVHQRKAGDWDRFDEDKIMLGFASQEDAERAYLAHYNDKRYLGPVTAMPMDEFKAKARATKEKPAMIKSIGDLFKAKLDHTKLILIPITDKSGRKSARWKKLAAPRSRGKDTATEDLFDPRLSGDLFDPSAARELREKLGASGKRALFRKPEQKGDGGVVQQDLPFDNGTKSPIHSGEGRDSADPVTGANPMKPDLSSPEAYASDPVLAAQARVLANKHYDKLGRGRVSLGDFKREFTGGKHADIVQAYLDVESKRLAKVQKAVRELVAPNGYEITISEDSHIHLSGPFDSDLHARIKRAGGYWDGKSGHNTRAWIIHIEKAPTLKRILSNWGGDAAAEKAKQRHDEERDAFRKKELERWLGYVEEAAEDNRVYQKGVDKLRKELDIASDPQAAERLDAALAKVAGRREKLEQEKAKIATAKQEERRTATYLDVPYEDKDYARRYGAKWNPERRQWYVVGKVPDELRQYDPRPQALPEGHYRISAGEGYGGRPFVVGETFRHARADAGPAYVTVVSAGKQYFREDGMSFGVGDESGHVFWAVVRPATDKEAAPVIAENAWRARRGEIARYAEHIRRRRLVGN